MWCCSQLDAMGADSTVSLAGSQQGVSDAKFLRRGQISEVSGK
jgi:hypothetical protein